MRETPRIARLRLGASASVFSIPYRPVPGLMLDFEIEARIANPPEGLLAKYTRKEKEFFYDYANFVHHLLTTAQVREQFRNLIRAEQINPGRAIDLRIMVFPARPLTGRPRNILHGSFNHDSSQISIYPLKLPREWVRKEGYGLFKTRPEDLSLSQQDALRDMLTSAISTLIHEILHVKFQSRQMSRYVEEAVVRKLERKYAVEWLAKISSEPSALTRPVEKDVEV